MAHDQRHKNRTVPGRWYRYVPHAAVSAYVAAGWIDTGHAPGAHGFYSSIVKFVGEVPPEVSQ